MPNVPSFLRFLEIGGDKGMKKLCMILAMMVITAVLVSAQCAIIEDGTIVDTKGNQINTGFDKWGYNYQAHLFNGLYWNYSRPAIPWTKQTLIDAGMSTTILVMKWSDTWLSNKDCNLDGILDRGYSCNPENPVSSACLGAWVTNHQSGWVDVNGKMRKWTYFVKIVMVPDDAYTDTGYWFTADGIEIGSVIWGAYARILQISNDPSIEGEHGVYYKSPASPGFGKY